EKELPGFFQVISLIAIPLVLILVNTMSDLLLTEGTLAHSFLTFIGDPFVALTITVILTFYVLGTKRGYTKEEIQDIATKSLEPAGIIILVTGAGGVLKQLLIDRGVGDVLGEMMVGSSLPVIALAFIMALSVRVAAGSATVARVTAAGLLSPVPSMTHVPQPMLGLTVIAIASGSTALSPVTDSGFWPVNR